jgi:X-Pro dipeptidyl-peptidase
MGIVRIALVAAGTALALATPAAAEPPPWLKIEDGVSQPQFDLANAIEQTVFVESAVDSNHDGARDRIRIRISRPGETATQGIKVPVVFEHSPYRGPFGSIANHPVEYDLLPQEGGMPELGIASAGGRAQPDLPGGLDNYYVPRGYAVVLGESVGSGQSDGCSTSGDIAETLGTKAVIDWLGGRARGFDEAGNPVRADWTTGAVGMVGVSYNGTLPNQVATTGVPGLKTIVPISAISSWYDYYRANGLVVAPHSQTQGVGENEFQGEDLDVLARFTMGDARADSECADELAEITERQDRVTGDYSAFWHDRDYLHRARDVRASVFVVHGLNDWNVKTKAFAAWWERLRVPRKIWLHDGGHGGPAGPSDYKRTENRWFDHWLFGVRNGIMDEPRATVQREDGAYEQHADWPLPGARSATLELGHGGPQSFVDRGRELDTDDALLQNPDVAHPNRLVYRWPTLRRAVHLSGTPWVELRVAVHRPHRAANLTAVLVDYDAAGSPLMVTRGWTEAGAQARGVRFDLQPDDYVFAAGHRIGLVVVSTDHDYTLRPQPGTKLSLWPSSSELELPVVGGRRALGF